MKIVNIITKIANSFKKTNIIGYSTNDIDSLGNNSSSLENIKFGYHRINGSTIYFPSDQFFNNNESLINPEDFNNTLDLFVPQEYNYYSTVFTILLWEGDTNIPMNGGFTNYFILVKDDDNLDNILKYRDLNNNFYDLATIKAKTLYKIVFNKNHRNGLVGTLTNMDNNTTINLTYERIEGDDNWEEKDKL